MRTALNEPGVTASIEQGSWDCIKARNFVNCVKMTTNYCSNENVKTSAVSHAETLVRDSVVK